MRTTLLIALSACAPMGASSSGSMPDAPPPVDGTVVTVAEPTIPAPTGTCPAITAGDVTFSPAGMAPRKVRLALDPAQANGPLVLYWHATGSAPAEASYSLGAMHDAIIEAGGVVATPFSDAGAGTFEWWIVNGSNKPDDFVLADEIVGCLVQAGRIDPLRVHSMGMSAGALQTTALSFLRSSYVASVVTYSGGMPDGFDPPTQDPANKFAALIFSGGAADNVFGLDFQAASMAYRNRLDTTGHFTALCDHGSGHEIPLDAAPAVRAFFDANPFGAWPSPYAGGLPTWFPAYCSTP